MERDDALNPSLTCSSIAWSSIGIAVDHLGLADDSLQREGGGLLRPFAFYTLCRGALVAASQAIWVMSGSRDVRLRRTRLVELLELEGVLSFLRDYSQDDSLAGLVSEEFLTSLDQRSKDVAERHKALKADLRPARGENSVTRMLKDAANVIHDARDEDEWLKRAYLAEWRLASGTAHARIWPGDIRPNEVLPIVGQRAKIRITSATTESYGTSLAAASMATSEAFRLWDQHALKS
jgi:hypothetical protein